MGFNKRYINRKNLQEQRKGGIKNLINFVTKPDALVIEDKFSQNVCNIIFNSKKIELELEKIEF